jgi:protein O-GlcNAc transferase
MLSNVGLADLIASTEDEYVERAAALSADTARLSALRSTLRDRMQAAPNMDGPRFARALEAAYIEVWEAYCTKAQ